MCVCMYVCMFACMFVCMHVCMYAWMYVRLCVCMYYVYSLPIYVSVCSSVQASIIICQKGPWISLLFLNITFFRVWPSLLKKLFSVAVIVIDASLICQLPWPRSQCVKALTRNSSQSGAYRQENTTRASLRLQILITSVTAHGFLWLTGLIIEMSDFINRLVDRYNDWTIESLRWAIGLTITRTFNIYVVYFTTLSVCDCIA
jgi:hypothetical protein